MRPIFKTTTYTGHIHPVLSGTSHCLWTYFHGSHIFRSIRGPFVVGGSITEKQRCARVADGSYRACFLFFSTFSLPAAGIPLAIQRNGSCSRASPRESSDYSLILDLLLCPWDDSAEFNNIDLQATHIGTVKKNQSLSVSGVIFTAYIDTHMHTPHTLDNALNRRSGLAQSASVTAPPFARNESQQSVTKRWACFYFCSQLKLAFLPPKPKNGTQKKLRTVTFTTTIKK